jgi:hypothetical protein
MHLEVGLLRDEPRAGTSTYAAAIVARLDRGGDASSCAAGGWADGPTGAAIAVGIVFVVVLTAAVIRGTREGVREGIRRRSQLPDGRQAKSRR